MTPIEGIRQLKKRGLITDELCREAFDAYAIFDEDRVQEIYDQHATLLDDVSHETVSEKARKLKAVQLYKKVCKTLKHEMFKHSKQHKSDHTCSKCDTKFPSRDDFKKLHSHKTYPLMVCSNADLIQHIIDAGYMTVQECMSDNAFFNHDNYYVVCYNCKRNPFAKK